MTTTHFLDRIMGNVFGTKNTPALPGSYFIGLSSSTPAMDGTGVTEPVASAGYERIQLSTLSAPRGGVISNSDIILFPESTADWGTMTYFVIYDAKTGGNLLMYDTLSVARRVEANTIVTLKGGSLTLTLANPTKAA